MVIKLTGKNVAITDALREQVNKKVGKLEKYFPADTEAQVTMSVQNYRHIVEVTIPFNGLVIRAEEATDDMYASIDKVLDKLERQIHKHKTKLEKKLKNGAFKYDASAFGQQIEPEEEQPRVVKTKRFPLKPMTVDEAILQMELLGHSFFVFTNADTEQVNVLYKRKDGNYGLIEPEYM
ncbi:MAG: putative sigma-54 modulation protein [Clostridiales bacterium]|jgi:putative sigma-54 modulation protein|nr:putative sigma-54 modulation protein [Clostridiales bacterium]